MKDKVRNLHANGWDKNKKNKQKEKKKGGRETHRNLFSVAHNVFNRGDKINVAPKAPDLAHWHETSHLYPAAGPESSGDVIGTTAMSPHTRARAAHANLALLGVLENPGVYRTVIGRGKIAIA
jgi:hypothetical protein